MITVTIKGSDGKENVLELTSLLLVGVDAKNKNRSIATVQGVGKDILQAIHHLNDLKKKALGQVFGSIEEECEHHHHEIDENKSVSTKEMRLKTGSRTKN